MKRSILYTIIFLLTVILSIPCLTGYFFCFYDTTEEGDSYYHTKVSENIYILNYRKSIKNVSYCFTTGEVCDDYLSYDGDLNKKFLDISIDYPDSKEGSKICVKIKDSSRSVVRCGDTKYVVDSYEPKIESLYNEVIMIDDTEKLEDLFDVKSTSGIKNFSCNYNSKNSTIECKAVGNNGLTNTYTKKVYTTNNHKLEGKKILFSGDSITAAVDKFDGYSGYAGRVGLSNYMDWKNVGVNGATIAKTKTNEIVSQIKKAKDEEFDYVILQGGINDLHYNVELGEISQGFERSDFDDKTFAGGLEKLFYYTKKYNPNSKIGFIITYETPNSNWVENIEDRNLQNKLIKEICDKWEIPYLDLYDGVVYDNGEISSYSEILKVNTGELFYKQSKSEIHLGYEGYNVVSKYISAWINTL